jgi:hypothetical protein
MVSTILSIPGNNIHNDHILFIDLIDKVLSGTYDWSQLGRDTFISPHFAPLPILIEVFLAMSGFWSVHLQALIGVGFLLAAALMQWSALSTQLSRFTRALLATCILAIDFGASNVSSLVDGFFSLHQVTLPIFGLSLSIYSLVKIRNRGLLGPVLAGMGGLVASYSFGVAIPVWATIFLTTVSQGYKKMRELAVLAVFGLLSFYPYAYFMRPGCAKFGLRCTTPTFDGARFINLLGRPLSNGFAFNLTSIRLAELSACFGLIALIGLFYLALNKKLTIKALNPAMSFIFYGITASFMITSLRDLIAPWYVPHASMFWIGLIGIAVSILDCAFDDSLRLLERCLAGVAGGTTLGCWLVLYWLTNHGFDDKQFYARALTPASESFFRHYRSAPTYGENFLFKWQPGNQGHVKTLCSVPYKHNLLCFGRNQEWSLQGDFLMHTVTFDPGIAAPVFVVGNSLDNAKEWHSFHQLNLALSAPQSVSWSIELPRTADNVKFNTALILAVSKTKKLPEFALVGDKAFGIIEIRSVRDHSVRRVSIIRKLNSRSQWQEVDVPLTDFAGEKVVISLHATQGYCVFRYPKLSFTQIPETHTNESSARIVPENTDLSPFFPTTQFGALVLPVKPGPKMHIICPPNTVLKNFSHLYLQVEKKGQPEEAVLNVVLTCKGKIGHQFYLPLLLDNKKHGYTYDLKLAQFPLDAQVRSIDITCTVDDKLSNLLKVDSLKLLRVGKQVDSDSDAAAKNTRTVKPTDKSSIRVDESLTSDQ